MSSDKAEATSFPNIALIKYWGKKDTENNIPTNSSISLSLPKLVTKTIIMSTDEDHDIFFLNGDLFNINQKMKHVINIFKSKKNENTPIRIDSFNEFPHSCGLASSASGISALVKALNIYYETNLTVKEMSEIARIGSGSACRSIESGLVKWIDTYAVKVGDWEDIKIFNIVLNELEKDISSTEGMIRTIETSSLFQHRLLKIDEKIKLVESFVKNKHFEELGKLVMKESNEMHAVCLDSYPPIFYLNEKSIGVIKEVMKLNEKNFVAFYSFDAGPNPFIFVLKSNYDYVHNHFIKEFGYRTIAGR